VRTARFFSRIFRIVKICGFLVVFASILEARAALLFYEGFDYPNGEQLGDVSVTSRPWQNHKSQFTIAAGSLESSGLKNPIGNRLHAATTSPSMDSVRTIPLAWEAQSRGALYLSFLLRIESKSGIDTATNGTSVLTISKTANNTQLFGVNLLNHEGIKLGVIKYPSTNLPVSSAFFSSGPGANLCADGSKAYLVVAKYEWVAGADNDIVTVWIDPETLDVGEDPAHKVFTNSGSDGSQPAGRLTLSRGPNLSIDEIRIGQNWADVTPTNVPRVAQK
jgi:hypothetical protein